MAWALRSVMPRAGCDVAQPRARVVGDAQQHPAWLVRKLQLSALENLSLFPEICC
jgi:hypothetical protein